MILWLVDVDGPAFPALQLYGSSKPKSSLSPRSLSGCLMEIRLWFSSYFLKLNSNNREVLLVGTASTLPKLHSFSINMDTSHFSFQSHINQISQSAYFHLCNINAPHPFLTLFCKALWTSFLFYDQRFINKV